MGGAFTGGASAESCWGQGKTYRLDPCGTYAMVSLDYKTGGTWYGPYYTYQWNNYLYAADRTVLLDCSNVYTEHQIYTAGNWQQIQSLMVW